MRVLGIDPGLGRTGVAMVTGSAGRLRLEASYCLETPPHTPDAARLADILQQLGVLIQQLSPDVAAVESLYFTSNRTTAMQVAQARGVILAALGRAAIETVAYTPNQVKEAVAGFGSAGKAQVATMTRRLLTVETIAGPDDVADACAVAICHHHRAGLGVTVKDHDPSRPVSGLDRAVAAARNRLGGAPA